MYECIRVKTRSSTFPNSILNEEGDLDNESEDSDFDREMEMVRNKTASQFVNRPESASSVGSKSSTVARYGSATPMSVD